MSSDPHEEIPPIAERRTGRRIRALLAGKIVYRDGSQSFDCSIRNLSDAGAQITVVNECVVPTHAYLIDLRSGTAYESVVTWIRPPRYGLRFDGAIALEGLTDPKLAFLRRLWLSCGKRPAA